MKLTEYMKDRVLFLDGGTGTLLQKQGLAPGEAPETWCVTHPESITALHRAYFEAGSDVIATNTFGVNRLKYETEELRLILTAAVDCAKRARAEAGREADGFISLDVGPLGRLLRPLGDLDFEEAVSVFREAIRYGASLGVDAVTIETFTDSYETKAAILAAREVCDLPLLVSNAYGEDGKLMTGATPEIMTALCEGMGVTALGLNCSYGPDKLLGVAKRLTDCASVPVIFKPNAGLPRVENGETVFDTAPEDFARAVNSAVEAGVRIVGGCCGTTPDYIRALKTVIGDRRPVPLTKKNISAVTSYCRAVEIGSRPVVIGERINPTGKKAFKEALRTGDRDYALREGIAQQEAGAQILDVNVGLPEIDEAACLTETVKGLQAVTDLPLQIDTSDPAAMEQALRIYNGKPLINSVSGKEESMTAIFPLVKKYGGVVVALTLDENGIPADAEGRVAIAKKILTRAAEYGIDKKDLMFDPLAMTVSADTKAPGVTLEAVRRITGELGCHTSLGVSNVSFGLPERDTVNAVFFALALENGLSAAIMNPFSDPMRRSLQAYMTLHGMDENCGGYLAYVAAHPMAAGEVRTTGKPENGTEEKGLSAAIRQGRAEQATVLTAELLKTKAPMEIIREEIIPALDQVGKGFEAKTLYLPQLLMSAEAAGSAFETIRKAASDERKAQTKGRVILATVRGDIHDIGKNIVRLLLENYGFAVTDLGKDVPPETVLEAVLRERAPLVGLSALMTTTVPAMEETIRLLRDKAPFCKIAVGGAVLTRAYAAEIGADRYCADAMETVRWAEEMLDHTKE